MGTATATGDGNGGGVVIVRSCVLLFMRVSRGLFLANHVLKLSDTGSIILNPQCFLRSYVFLFIDQSYCTVS